MEHIYIAMVDTPGALAYLIRRFLRQRYIHVVVSMDKGLKEAYSFGRRNPRIPVFAGFEREDKEEILRTFPTAGYMVCELDCSAEQKEGIKRQLREDYRRRRHYHYAVFGLFFVACGIPFYQKNHYTCSSYIARVLKENHIDVSKKHFSLVTPKDFYLYPDKCVIFEGSLEAFVALSQQTQQSPAASGQGSGRKRWTGRRGRMAVAYGR